MKMFSLTRYCFYFLAAANFLCLCEEDQYQSHVQDKLNDYIKNDDVHQVGIMLSRQIVPYANVSALIPDSNGNRPLKIAIDYDRRLIAALLLYYGADLRAIEPSCKSGCNLFLYAVSYNRVKLVDQFLRFDGSLINSIDADKKNGLHYTAIHSYFVMANMLLEYGLNVDATDVNRKTALHYACQNGFLGIVEVLLSYNARVDIQDISKHVAIYYVPKNGYGQAILAAFRDFKPSRNKYAFLKHDRKLLQLESKERMIDDNFKLSQDKRAWLIGSLAETFGTKKKNISSFLYSNYCRNLKLYQ